MRLIEIVNNYPFFKKINSYIDSFEIYYRVKILGSKWIRLTKPELYILYTLYYRGGRAKMSRIMADTNLSTLMFLNYSELLIEKGLLETGEKRCAVLNDELCYGEYKLTLKGRRKIKRIIKRLTPEIIYEIKPEKI